MHSTVCLGSKKDDPSVKTRIEKVVSGSHHSVPVHVIDAEEEEVVGVDQVIGGGGDVILHPDEQGPAEVKHVPGVEGGFFWFLDRGPLQLGQQTKNRQFIS